MPRLPDLQFEADLTELGPYADRFQPLGPDAERDAWIARYAAAPHGAFVTKFGAWLDSLLSSYDVHGLLGTYPMHLLSRQAWGALLAQRYGSLLDVGAGAGYVTEGARAHFDHIECSETSRFLRRRLEQRGFTTHACDLSRDHLARHFDVVSCFNVLDRTARPLSLLHGLIAHLKPHGRLLLSLPLPVNAHVHVAGGTIAASERLPAAARSWEGAVRELSARLFEANQLAIERIARVPYLSRGDSGQDLYALDAALWVLSSSLPPGEG
jgi:2-polyprenyl-3-methyl-5-hydroxy-6-metoxy-1,4-benzoquinol methylase